MLVICLLFQQDSDACLLDESVDLGLSEVADGIEINIEKKVGSPSDSMSRDEVEQCNLLVDQQVEFKILDLVWRHFVSLHCLRLFFFF